MTTIAARWRVDVGRLAMVPLAAIMLIREAGALVLGAVHPPATPGGALRWVSALLVCVFYVMIVWCYLRRGPAVASTRSLAAAVVAVVATNTVFVFPLLHSGLPGMAGQVAADVLLVLGTAWSLWSLRFLGRNLSVIAQARGIADRGPYRLVRHPLYTGEIVSTLGLAIAAGTPAGYGLWLAIVVMQVYRATQEEKVLTATLPGYQAYRSRTAALLPGVF